MVRAFVRSGEGPDMANDGDTTQYTLEGVIGQAEPAVMTEHGPALRLHEARRAAKTPEQKQIDEGPWS